MRSFAFGIALALVVSSCDSTGPTGAEALPGTWEMVSSEALVTVVSRVDQRYYGFDLPAPDGIAVSGVVTDTLRYLHRLPVSMPGSDFADLRSCWGAANCASPSIRSTVLNGAVYLSVDPSGNPPMPRRDYQAESPDISYRFADYVLTIPPFEVPTPDGPLRMGGTLTLQTVPLPAGVPTELPPVRDRSRSRLTLDADGTARQAFPDGTSQAGQWEAVGDRIRLTWADAHFPVEFGFEATATGLILTTDPFENILDFIESVRMIPEGSLESASVVHRHTGRRVRR